MTHPDWRKILSFACEQTDLCEVKLQTNGTLLNERVVEALASLDHKKLLIQISMEGASEKTHDPIRGEGTFRRAMRAIQCLFEAGMGNQIVVAFTEMHHNFGDLPLLLKLLEPFNIRSLVSGTLVCGGRALRDQEITGPTTSQYKNLLYRYSVDPQFRESYEQFGNIAALEWYKGRAHSSQNGCALIKNLYITGHGRMYPCPLLQADDFSVLNVHEEALENALLGALPKWAALSRISQQRPAELRPCEGCPGRVHCAGGCMGRAYSVHGEFMFPEDRCLLRRTVYSWKPPEAPPE
jgi:radical SAM protein with 4Fe4S-binding SPASM domain